VDKALIRKTLAGRMTTDSRDTKGHNSSNLRSVKSLSHGGVGMLRKPGVDSNLLNNSYDLDDAEVLVGFSTALSGPSLPLNVKADTGLLNNNDVSVE
jgi:hypothetical protein